MKKFYIKKRTLYKVNYSNIKIGFSEHFAEIRERLFQFLGISIIFFVIPLLNFNIISQSILTLIPEIQFFQISPQDFLISTFIISLNVSLIITFPNLLKYLMFYFGPSFTIQEKQKLFPLLGISLNLSVLSLHFCYGLLAPLTFKFFLNYGHSTIEPFWSFNDFSNFLAQLVYSTLLIFHLPLIQILFNIFNIIKVEKLKEAWKIVLCLAFLISGILTPSTDPLTQVILASVIYILYYSGIALATIIY